MNIQHFSKFIISSILVFFLFQIGNAQDEEKTTEPKYLTFNFTLGVQIPGGDMGKRFGLNNTVGLNIEYVTPKNYIFGLQSDILFGRRVKEDVLFTLRNQDGQIVGNNRAISAISLTQRGLNVNVLLGKIWNLNKKQPKSGIRTTIAAGILQHKIRIQKDPQSGVPQAEGEYAKGYDRLTNGLAFTEFIGYQKISNNRRINFYIGLELVQAITKNRRDFNFDTMMKDDETKFDSLIGLKAGWTLPLHINRNPEEIFY